MGYSSHPRMSTSCSVSMEWKMYFTCYTHRQNNPMLHFQFMYFLLLKLKSSVYHWCRNLCSVFDRLQWFSTCISQERVIKWYALQKCPDSYLKIYTFLRPFFFPRLEPIYYSQKHLKFKYEVNITLRFL